MAKTGAGAGPIPTIELVPKRGRALRLVPSAFRGYSGAAGWAALLLDRCKDASVLIEPETARRLRRAANTIVR
jgi:hypothetical protein